MAEPDPADVVIIGAGPAGGVAALRLVEAGLRVVCLEQGDWVKPTDYPSNGRDWEARLFGDFATSPNRRAHHTHHHNAKPHRKNNRTPHPMLNHRTATTDRLCKITQKHTNHKCNRTRRLPSHRQNTNHNRLRYSIQ